MKSYTHFNSFHVKPAVIHKTGLLVSCHLFRKR